MVVVDRAYHRMRGTVAKVFAAAFVVVGFVSILFMASTKSSRSFNALGLDDSGVAHADVAGGLVGSGDSAASGSGPEGGDSACGDSTGSCASDSGGDSGPL